MLPPLSEISGEYFTRGSVECQICHTHVDVWEAARSAVQWAASFIGLQALGAHRTNFLFPLAAGEGKELDLTAYGIPKNATVLSINYTPQGGNCLPTEAHGNTPRRRIIGTTIHLYGRPIVGSSDPPGLIAVGVNWVHHDESSEAWFYLVDAMEALATRRYWHVILPAHAAVEISIMPVVRQTLEKHLSKSRVEAFSDELSYSSALNAVLPLLCKFAKVPTLPDAILGELNRLRKLRNDFVHEGITEEAVSEKLAAEMLCASVFGFEYARYVRPQLLCA